MWCSSICPQDVWQFFHPFSLRIIQPLLKPIHYDFINSFGLLFSLWIGWSGISIFYPQIGTVFPEGSAIELKAIIRDEGMRNPESSNNTLLEELFDIHIPDISQRFSFDPLGEIICAD